jgi:cellulose biosynthesis protein BcsQ
MLSNGRIVTFYSYKGGTGRTMAAANMAWILASNGKRVLLIDWDLESPGLHRYLRPFLTDSDLTDRPGLIDFFSAAKPKKLLDFVVPVNWTFSAGGSLDFLAAGRLDKNYPRRVNLFNWAEFYDRRRGNRLIEEVRDTLKATYDYVLIDSRTGISDASGICTVHMPDLLVVFFTLNHQSMEGSAAMAASIRTQRPDLPIFPVPTRVEYGEQDKLSAAQTFARRIFAPFLLHVQSNRQAIDPEQQARYWQEVETPYVAYYAFEEILAAFKDELGSRRGLLAASERLSSWITDRDVSSLNFSGKENRRAILERFAFDKNRATKFDWAAPARKSWALAAVERIFHRAVRYRWQAAAVVLAVAVIVLSALAIYGKLSKPEIQSPAKPKIGPNWPEPRPSTHRDGGSDQLPAPRQNGEPSHQRE